jgi:hypothetical protein
MGIFVGILNREPFVGFEGKLGNTGRWRDVVRYGFYLVSKLAELLA